MTLAALIRKRGAGKVANDNPAKVANDGQARGEPLAGLAALALASLPSPKTATAQRHGLTLAAPQEAELAENIREHFEERAAIREYDGHESRKEAEAKARAAMRVYEYRLTDNGPDGPWLILLAPGCDLLEAERSLKSRFGADRVQDVRERRHD